MASQVSMHGACIWDARTMYQGLWIQSRYAVCASRMRVPCIEVFKASAPWYTVHASQTCAVCCQGHYAQAPTCLHVPSPCLYTREAMKQTFMCLFCGNSSLNTWCLCPGHVHCVLSSSNPWHSTFKTQCTCVGRVHCVLRSSNSWHLDTWCTHLGHMHHVSKSLKPHYSTSIHGVCVQDACTVYRGL